MMPPRNTSIPKLAEETGISDATLYNWRKQARLEGFAVLADGKNSEQWSSADKFVVVLEAASMNEAQLGEYCREKGLYPEQIAASNTTTNLSADDHCSEFLPSASTANPSNLACLRQLYNVASEIPVSSASLGIEVLRGGIIFSITAAFHSSEQRGITLTSPPPFDKRPQLS